MKKTMEINLRNHAIGDQNKIKTTGNKSASVTGSGAMLLDETWEIFLSWVNAYAGDEATAARASYSREDMRYAFAAGYAKAGG